MRSAPLRRRFNIVAKPLPRGGFDPYGDDTPDFKQRSLVTTTTVAGLTLETIGVPLGNLP